MNAVIFKGKDLQNLRERFNKEAPEEAAAVLLAGHTQTKDSIKFLVREIHFPSEESFSEKTNFRVEIKPEFLAPILKKARDEGWALLFVHSHPFAEFPTFSTVDDDGERLLAPTVFSRAPDRPHGWLVFGKRGFDGRLRTAPDVVLPIDEIVECGTNYSIWPSQEDQAVNVDRDDRTVRAIGEDGQKQLQKLAVGIVGLGGMGSIVAEQLGHLGVKNFVLVDHDVLDRSNLNRVVGSTPTDVGRPKVDIAKEMIEAINPDAVAIAHKGSILHSEWGRKLLDCNVVICCTDSHGSRAVLNQLAYQYLIPVLDLGVRIDAPNLQLETFGGRVQMLSPGLPCLTCQNFLDPSQVRLDLMTEDEIRRDPYVVGAQVPQPAVISLNCTVGSLGITMLISYVTQLPMIARQQIYQGEKGVVRVVSSSSFHSCIVCSNDGALGRGDLWSMPWRPSGSGSSR